jgi:hypothetical protein
LLTIKPFNMSREFSKTLRELGFRHIAHGELSAWEKKYDSFSLFIAQAHTGKLIASIVVGKDEISIPAIADEYWVVEFDALNTAAQ